MMVIKTIKNLKIIWPSNEGKLVFMAEIVKSAAKKPANATRKYEMKKLIVVFIEVFIFTSSRRRLGSSGE